MQDKDPLATLAWLVEAGADEAIQETPVNRLKAPAAQATVAPMRAPASAAAPAKTPAPVAGDNIGSAMAAAASAMDLAQLKAALETFEGSALKRQATNTVFSDGVADSRIMLIGEAPGRDEDRIGKPFVGRAGQLLTDIIERGMRMRRQEVYICNVVKCRPPGNRNPEIDEVAACEPFLNRQIELVRPQIIVGLGTFAVQSLLKVKIPISKLRGRWHDVRGIRMMPTFHPAYLLRNPADKRLVWADIQEVMKALGKELPNRKS